MNHNLLLRITQWTHAFLGCPKNAQQPNGPSRMTGHKMKLPAYFFFFIILKYNYIILPPLSSSCHSYICLPHCPMFAPSFSLTTIVTYAYKNKYITTTCWIHSVLVICIYFRVNYLILYNQSSEGAHPWGRLMLPLWPVLTACSYSSQGRAT